MKTLKYLFIALFLTIALTRQVSAFDLPPDYFGNLRVEITNQLAIASNAVPVNKSLIGKLKFSLRTLDKNTTNTIAPGAKALLLLTRSLNKTTVSNVFDDELQLIIVVYNYNYFVAKTDLDWRLAATYSGRKRDAAQKYLDKLGAAMAGANTNLDSNLATKALVLASKYLTASLKAVTRAEGADAPPAFVTATIARPGLPSIAFSAKPPFAEFQLVNTNAGSFTINAHMPKGTAVNNLVFNYADLLYPGQKTVSVSGGYTLGPPPMVPYSSVNGNSQVTWNQEHKNLYGTFTLHISDGLQTGTVTGSFNMYYP